MFAYLYYTAKKFISNSRAREGERIGIKDEIATLRSPLEILGINTRNDKQGGKGMGRKSNMGMVY
jgi:hypothetical protein